MRKPLLLDLFCGAGGAAVGYAQAGFEVIGIDMKPQPNYPFRMVQGDALKFVEAMWPGMFDAIHASPPCQGYSALNRVNKKDYPKLVEDVRYLLQQQGTPYVIENVPGAPLIDPIVLCGSQFRLETYWPGKGKVGLRRHRLFESNLPVKDPGPHDHSLLSVPIYGHGVAGNRTKLRGPGAAQAARDVMQIHWMTRKELDQAIPPAYTQYIGKQLLEVMGH